MAEKKRPDEVHVVDPQADIHIEMLTVALQTLMQRHNVTEFDVTFEDYKRDIIGASKEIAMSQTATNLKVRLVAVGDGERLVKQAVDAGKKVRVRGRDGDFEVGKKHEDPSRFV